MRIVITGASGNVGSALLRRLTAAGTHELVGVARRPPAAATPPFDQVAWVATDLSEPSAVEDLAEAFRGADAVVHLAWAFQPSHDVGYLGAVALGGTRRVLEAAAAAEVGHVVHMSSVGAYSAKADDVPVDETWPTEGVPSSWYSRHKAAAERLLDGFEEGRSRPVVTRMRPGIVGQRSAGSSLLRYALPAAVPAGVLGIIPVLPLDRRLVIPMVHADDVADAVARAVEGRVAGPFNLAAEPPVRAADIASALDARLLDVPSGVVRSVVALTWHGRLQQLDPGWIDLGYSVPLLNTGRAARELGWSPMVDGATVLDEVLAGMREADADRTPVLRPRGVLQGVGRFLQHGPVSSRRRP